MEEDGDGEDSTPFWLQSTTNAHRTDRLRRSVSSLFFSSGLVVLLLLVTALFLLVFVVPSTLSFSSRIFRPTSVKKGWDSLNIVLVLVAVVFGFLSRNKNEDRYSYSDGFQDSPNKLKNQAQKSNPSTPNHWHNYSINEGEKSNISAPNQWYGYSDYQTRLEQKNAYLRRNSSSYPDLRESSSVHWGYGDFERGSYDDFHVDPVRVPDQGRIHRRHRSLEGVDHLIAAGPVKTVIVDTLLSKSEEATNLPQVPELEENQKPPTHAPPPSAQPPLPVSESPELLEKPKRPYESAGRKKGRSSRKLHEDVVSGDAIDTTPQPPPPPPPPSQQRISKSDRKRDGATGSATKDFLNSLYHKKKKKQRQKSVDNLDSLQHEVQAPLHFQLPPPPPSPPPPSVLQNMFSSKKHKRKRTITVTVTPSPPSLPQEPAIEPKPSPSPLTNPKPSKATVINRFDKLEENTNSGEDSPVNRIPPPPPPPPPAFFKPPAWKFVVEGDYVRVNSNTSSRSGSPDTDDANSDATPTSADGGNATPFHPSPLFCPSPDVNTKAESFITNFRAKLKLEKNHSMKKRELGPSSLGPGPGTGQV